MSLRLRKKSDETQGIDISPLIDMVFILLIFFMVSTTFVKDLDLDIDRPSASTAKPSSAQAIRVFIDKQGNTFVDGQPVRIWVVQSRVRELLAAGKLVEVVDQARLGGATDVGVATQAEAGGV